MKNTFLGLLTALSLSLGGALWHLHRQLESPVRQFVILVTPTGPVYAEANETVTIEKMNSDLLENTEQIRQLNEKVEAEMKKTPQPKID